MLITTTEVGIEKNRGDSAQLLNAEEILPLKYRDYYTAFSG